MQSRLKKASIEEILREIVRLSELCMKPTGVWRGELVRALGEDFGFSSFKSRCVINSLFGRFSWDAITQYVESRNPLYREGEDAVGFVFPSNVPDPMVEDVFCAFSERKYCVIKSSARTKEWGRAFLEGVRRESPLFRNALRWTVSREDFFKEAKSCDVATVYGDASSVSALRKAFLKKVRLRVFGPRLSFGVIFRSALAGGNLEETARRCALDIYWYDQRGCLSPQVYFVQGSPDNFAKALNDELKILNDHFGVIRRSYNCARSRRIFIGRLVAECLGGRVKFVDKLSDGTAPLVAIMKRSSFTPGPSGQVVVVKSFRSLPGILKEMKPFVFSIQGISIAGREKERSQAVRIFEKTSASYIADPGALQSPPLGWNRQTD